MTNNNNHAAMPKAIGNIKFNGCLLYAILRLDAKFIDELISRNYLSQYLVVIGAMIGNISCLPKPIQYINYSKYDEEDMIEDASDSEEEAESGAQSLLYRPQSHDLQSSCGERVSAPGHARLSLTLKELAIGLVELAFPETKSAHKDHYRNIFANWFVAADPSLKFLVLSAMRILMQILKLKDAIADNAEHLTPLEQLYLYQLKCFLNK